MRASFHKNVVATICFAAINTKALALTLTSGQTNFITSGNITENASGIISSLAGTQNNPNRITNLHIITTGNSGAVSSAYGIRSTGAFNQITNSNGAEINTTGSSGRGISIAGGNSSAINQGTISTLGSSSYGIYVGGNNNAASNAGNILTQQAYGIYLDGNFNQLSNSGNIITQGGTSAYGVYISAGSSLAATENNFSSLDNSGNINAFDHGVYNRDHFSSLTNSGVITSGNVDDIYGINNEGNGAQINNSGTINANRYAIYNLGDNVTITNSGTLNGGLRLGNSNFYILGGSINGEFKGNDAANVHIGSNAIATNYTQQQNYEDLKDLTINQNSNFISNKTIEAQNIFIGEGANFNVSGGFVSSANIKGLSNNFGNINFSDIDFSGNLGAATNALANINIANNATLNSGNSIFAQNINNFGTLNLSSFGSIVNGNINNSGALNLQNSTHQINGNFTLNSGASLITEINNNGAGKLDIIGAATIDPNAKLNINFGQNNYIANGSRFTILSATNLTAGEISAQNISINNQNSNVTGLLRFSSVVDSNNIYLQANRLNASEISANKNIQNIYNSLNQIGDNSTDNLRNFQNYLDSNNLTQKQLEETLNQAAPFPAKANILTITNLLNNNIKIDERRLEKMHLKNHKNNNFWVDAFGSNLAQNKAGDDDEFSANTIGLAVGASKELSENSNIGFSFNYGRSEIKLSDDSKSNLINSAQINLFLDKNYNDYFIDFISSIALHKFSQTKQFKAINTSSNANYFGQSFATKIKLSKINNLPFHLKFIPFSSLNFTHNKIDGYKENGAQSLDLKVSAISANYLEARVGAAFGIMDICPHIKQIRNFTMLVKGSIGQNLINDKPTTKAEFINNQQKFEQKISQIDATSLQLGVELQAFHKDDVTFAFEYFTEKRSSLTSHFAIMKVTQAF